jgi:phospholipase/carboxylesterase
MHTHNKQLGGSIEAARTNYSLTSAPIAISFSNGAIIAAALPLTQLSLLAGAILFQPLSPSAGDLPTRLDGTPVLITDGEKGIRQSLGDGARLAERLIRAAATVTHHVQPVGHSTQRWIERFRGIGWEAGCLS